MKLSNYLLIGSALALLTTFVQAAPITEGQLYQLTDLGALPGKKSSLAAAINNAGQVVGSSVAEPLSEVAFRYIPQTGHLEPLANPLGSATRAFGLNDSGMVVGDSTPGAVDATRDAAPLRTAAIFRKGSVALIFGNTKKPRFSRATDVNNAGIVVGYSSADAEGKDSRSFVWTNDSGATDLGSLGGSFAQAVAVNDAGFVTGHSVISDAPATEGAPTHAFIGQVFGGGKVDTLIDLGTLGGLYSYGTAISEKNHVVGYSTVDATEGRMHAFLYDGGKLQDLGSLGSKGEKTDQSFALGVNVEGVTVGYSYLPMEQGAQQVGFIYQNGAMRNLNQLIGSGAKRYLIYSADAINDQGQIAATAFDNDNGVFHAVLLTPTSSIPTE